MNARLNICQAAHDAKLPPPVSETPEELAKAEWLYNAAEQLIDGISIKIQRRMHSPRIVAHSEFLTAVQMHLLKRWEDGCDAEDWFAQIVVDAAAGVHCESTAKNLLGPSAHSLGMLGEIAEKLLQPLVDDALIAQAEDDSL